MPGETTEGHRRPELSVVLPCYNEAEHIDTSVDRLISVLDTLGVAYELLFVDDCSRDDTRTRLARIARQHPACAITLIHHPANTGRGEAVADGIRASRGSVVGYLDVDLEVDAVYILAMLVAIRNGADCAVGARVYRVQPRYLHRHVLSRGYVWITRRVLNLPYADTEAGYKFFRRSVALRLLDQTRDPGWFWDTEILYHAHDQGLRVSEIPCLFKRNHDKTSTVRPVRDSVEYLRKLLAFRQRT